MLGTFSPTPCLLAKGKDLKIELIINDVHMVKPPFKESLKWVLVAACELLVVARGV